jgi:hypothetical protein
MGVYTTLFTDPTDSWPAQRRVALILEIPTLALNGIALGDPADALIVFGRPSNKQPFKHGRFVWSEVGLLAEIENRRIAYFAVALAHDEADALGPASLDLLLPKNARLTLDPTAPSDLLAYALGQPHEIDRDEEETILHYSFNDCRLEFECSPDGILKRVNWFQ